MQSKLTKAKDRVQRGKSFSEALSVAPTGHDHPQRDEIFDLVPAPVVVMDRDHTILNLNQTAAQVARRPLQDCIGLKFWDLFDNPGCRAGTCAAAQAIRTRAVATGEARPKIHGEEVPVRVVAAPKFDANHEVIGVVELIHNASEENRLNLEILRLVEAARGGKLSERGKAAEFESSQRELLEGINSMLDAILLPIGEGNRILAQISNGKIDELIAQTYKGDHEKMKQAVNNVGVVVQGLQKELIRLTKHRRKDSSPSAASADQFQGAYADIVRGVNAMLDAILLPIGEGNRILAQISNGKIDELIAQTYKGDHEKMKQAVNNVGVVLQSLQKELARLTEASKEGKLDGARQPGSIPGSLCQHRARRQRHPRCGDHTAQCRRQLRGPHQQG